MSCPRPDQEFGAQLCLFFLFVFFSVDASKEATFKVAPSKWEAVDESELEAQGEKL